MFNALRLIMRAPYRGRCTVLLVQIWAQKALGRIDHHEAGRNGQIVRAVNGGMTGIQFIIEARQRALVRGHARFCFQGYQQASDLGLAELR